MLLCQIASESAPIPVFISPSHTLCLFMCVCSSKVNFVPRLRFEILKLIIEFHRTYEKVNTSIDLSLGLCIPCLLLKYASQQRWDMDANSEAAGGKLPVSNHVYNYFASFDL